MTMSRDTKTTVQHAVTDIHNGQPVPSYSPRQLATYGRYLPTAVAIRMQTCAAGRVTIGKSRESWTVERIGRRKVTRR